jgi:hypothetical protein
VKIEDLLRQLEEIKGIYGNLPVKVLCGPCNHSHDVLHIHECFDDASVDVTDVASSGLSTARSRFVVID